MKVRKGSEIHDNGGKGNIWLRKGKHVDVIVEDRDV